MRARYYDPQVGRFTARDPFEGLITEPMSLTKYPYVNDNPVNNSDPSGLFAEDSALAGILQDILNAIPQVTPVQAYYLGNQIADSIEITALFVGAIVEEGITLYALRELAKDAGIPVLVFLGGNLQEHAYHVQDTQLLYGNTKYRIEALEQIQQSYSTPLSKAAASLERGSFISPLVVPFPSTWSFSYYAPVKTGQDNGRKFLDILDSNKELGFPPKTVARDEFPFSTTTGGGDNNFNQDKVSVRYVSDPESRKQGGLIRRFYNDKNVGLLNDNILLGRFIVAGIPQLRLQSGYITRQGNFIPVGK
jgi:hypothetical protein